MQREALAALDLGPEDRFLDVGCGPGATLRRLADSIRFGVGVDLSPEMVRIGRDLANQLEGVEFCVADSERLPFRDGEFTALLCSTSFHHYPNPGEAARQMARVLAPGGRLVLADPCSDLVAARIADVFLRRFEPGHVRLHRSAELGGFVQSAGLQRVRLRRLSSGGYAIVHGVNPGGDFPPAR